MTTILNFSRNLWLTWYRFQIFLQNRGKNINGLIIQLWFFLQCLILASMLLLNIIWPSVYKNNSLWKHYSQFLLPMMFGQPCTSVVVVWKKTELSLFTLFSKTLAVFIFWFQFHFYLTCLCVPKLRLKILFPVHTLQSNLFSSVIPRNTKLKKKKNQTSKIELKCFMEECHSC